MKVFERENISVTRPTLENISVTRPTLENISVTQPNLENISVNQPNFPISPSKNEFTISPSKNGKEHFTISDPEQLTQPTKFPEEYKKGHVQMARTQNHHCQTRNQRKRNAIRIISFVNTINITRQTHH